MLPFVNQRNTSGKLTASLSSSARIAPEKGKRFFCSALLRSQRLLALYLHSFRNPTMSISGPTSLQKKVFRAQHIAVTHSRDE